MNNRPFSFSFLPKHKGIAADLQAKEAIQKLLLIKPDLSAEEVTSFYGWMNEQQGGESLYEHDDLANIKFHHIV